MLGPLLGVGNQALGQPAILLLAFATGVGPGDRPRFDPVALHHYLSFHAVVPPPHTILKGVTKFPPATIRVIEPDGKAKDRLYWAPQLVRQAGDAGRSAEDWRDIVLESLRTAVKRRMVADVPVGVLLSGIFFAWKVSQIFRVTSTLSEDGSQRHYCIEGQVFFASAEDFLASFDFAEPLQQVTIDVSRAHIWDLTGVNAIDKAVLKFRKAGIAAQVEGLNEASATIMDRFAMQDRPNAMEKVLGH